MHFSKAAITVWESSSIDFKLLMIFFYHCVNLTKHCFPGSTVFSMVVSVYVEWKPQESTEHSRVQIKINLQAYTS